MTTLTSPIDLGSNPLTNWLKDNPELYQALVSSFENWDKSYLHQGFLTKDYSVCVCGGGYLKVIYISKVHGIW